MPADEFYTLGRITIEEIDSSSFENMPKFVEEIPLLEGVQGTIDGSPSIKKNPLNIYDLYALLTQGLQKKVASLGYATKALKKPGKPTFPNQLKSNDYRLKVLAFTAEAVRQFLSSALNEEVLHIPQRGTLRPHGKTKAGAHPSGLAWDHGDKNSKTMPTFFFENSKKVVPTKYVIAATAICIDQGIIKKGRLGMYETRSGGNPKSYSIKQMHYDYILWRQEYPSSFQQYDSEKKLLTITNKGWLWHYVRDPKQVKYPKKLVDGKYRKYFEGDITRRTMLRRAQKEAPDNTDIDHIIELYDLWSKKVAADAKIVTFDEYMEYLEELEEKGSRWKFLAKL